MTRDEGTYVRRYGFGTKRSRSIRRRTRLLLPAGFAWLGLVLVLLAPLVAAASSTTLKAPYAGYNAPIEYTASYSCPGATKVLTYPDFNLTSGHAVEAANTTAKSCPGPTYARAREFVFEQSGLFANLTSGLHGPVGFVARWSLSYTGNLHVHSGGAKQAALANVYVNVSGTLYNGTAFDASFTTIEKSYAINTSVGTNLPISVSKLAANIYLNATLSAGSQYAFYTYVTVFVECGVTMGGSSSADAQLEMSGHGNGAALSYFKF